MWDKLTVLGAFGPPRFGRLFTSARMDRGHMILLETQGTGQCGPPSSTDPSFSISNYSHDSQFHVTTYIDPLAYKDQLTIYDHTVTLYDCALLCQGGPSLLLINPHGPVSGGFVDGWRANQSPRTPGRRRRDRQDRGGSQAAIVLRIYRGISGMNADQSFFMFESIMIVPFGKTCMTLKNHAG